MCIQSGQYIHLLTSTKIRKGGLNAHKDIAQLRHQFQGVCFSRYAIGQGKEQVAHSGCTTKKQQADL
jgi:hypothetical protein